MTKCKSITLLKGGRNYYTIDIDFAKPRTLDQITFTFHACRETYIISLKVEDQIEKNRVAELIRRSTLPCNLIGYKLEIFPRNIREVYQAINFISNDIQKFEADDLKGLETAIEKTLDVDEIIELLSTHVRNQSPEGAFELAKALYQHRKGTLFYNNELVSIYYLLGTLFEKAGMLARALDAYTSVNSISESYTKAQRKLSELTSSSKKLNESKNEIAQLQRSNTALMEENARLRAMLDQQAASTLVQMRLREGLHSRDNGLESKKGLSRP